MAKEEQTIIGLNKPTIGLNKSTIALAIFVFSVMGYATFWKDRGGAQAKAEAIHNTRVSGLEPRILNVEEGLVKANENHSRFKETVVQRFNSNEKDAIKIQADQRAILRNQESFQKQLTKQNDLQIRRLEEDAKKAVRDEKLYEYLRSIENID